MTSRYSEIKELLGKPYSDLDFFLQCMATVLEEEKQVREAILGMLLSVNAIASAMGTTG